MGVQSIRMESHTPPLLQMAIFSSRIITRDVEPASYVSSYSVHQLHPTIEASLVDIPSSGGVIMSEKLSQITVGIAEFGD